MVRRKSEKQQVEVWTREPVNVAALKDLASRSAAGIVCWAGSDVEIRRLLCDYLACVDAEGYLKVRWYESPGVCDFATRRFSGGANGAKGRSHAQGAAKCGVVRLMERCGCGPGKLAF